MADTKRVATRRAATKRGKKAPARAVKKPKFRKVAVLMGGYSAEREVSLMSGSMVLRALNRAGVAAYPVDPSERPLSDLVAGGFDAVFIALHGRYGEDGTLQGALELARLPYTGAGVMSSAIAIDKIMTKRIWQSLNLRTPAYRELTSTGDLSAAWRELGGPCIVKPAREGSTLGLTKVQRAGDMKSAYALARRYDESVLAEQFIDGRELTIAIVGTGKQAKALPVIEIRAPGGEYDYQNKYFTNDTEYLCPAPLPAALTREVQAMSVAAYRALDGAGWGRIDVMLGKDNTPWLLELNTSPGMTDHSLVPMAAAAHGLAYDDLVVSILADASLKSSASGSVPGSASAPGGGGR